MTLKILVADDSVTIQKIVTIAFSSEDAEIRSVANGDDAVDLARDFRPDIVLADVIMPGCSGYEVCARIKADPELSRVPVLLLVGAFEAYDEAEAARVKSNGRLTKPFDTEELIQTVLSLAGGGRTGGPETTGLAADRRLKSFLGADRVLDIFDPATMAAAEAALNALPEEVKALPGGGAAAGMISEEALNAIVDRVVKRMSADVVREVAWEVVPELSEVIIRRTLDERSKP